MELGNKIVIVPSHVMILEYNDDDENICSDSENDNWHIDSN